jgi:hypothetical protein
MARSNLDYINEHRAAVGRPKLARTTPKAAIKRHLKLIDFFAPYGADPWAIYPKSDIAGIREAESARTTGG